MIGGNQIVASVLIKLSGSGAQLMPVLSTIIIEQPGETRARVCSVLWPCSDCQLFPRD